MMIRKRNKTLTILNLKGASKITEVSVKYYVLLNEIKEYTLYLKVI